jgi:hypothetical protein
MHRFLLAPLALAATVSLCGCLPMMAASAISTVATSARGPAVSNAHLKANAEAACTQRAAAYGTPYVIDVQQAKVNRIIVWGTAGDGASKQSFECHFSTAITAFKLRPITAR